MWLGGKKAFQVMSRYFKQPIFLPVFSVAWHGPASSWGWVRLPTFNYLRHRKFSFKMMKQGKSISSPQKFYLSVLTRFFLIINYKSNNFDWDPKTKHELNDFMNLSYVTPKKANKVRVHISYNCKKMTKVNLIRSIWSKKIEWIAWWRKKLWLLNFNIFSRLWWKLIFLSHIRLSKWKYLKRHFISNW